MDTGQRRTGLVRMAALPGPSSGPGTDRWERPARCPVGVDDKTWGTDPESSIRSDGHASSRRPTWVKDRLRVPPGSGDRRVRVSGSPEVDLSNGRSHTWASRLVHRETGSG